MTCSNDSTIVRLYMRTIVLCNRAFYCSLHLICRSQHVDREEFDLSMQTGMQFSVCKLESAVAELIKVK